MTLVFDNRTPFEALRFETLDQFDQGFHVFVAKVSSALGAPTAGSDEAVLTEMETPAPLLAEDDYWGELNVSSVRSESDLAPYKPRCDVIVNATAHAPGGKPARQFDVRLRVQCPDTPRPLPEPPRPLNPFMPVSDIALSQWKREVERLQANPEPGAMLVDKTLTVTGPRQFKKKVWPVRFLQWAIKWSTLTLIRPNPWKLTAPQKLAALPLRYEYAYGGQNRIDAGDKRAKRVPQKHRLDAEQRAAHPDRDAPAAQQAAAHEVYECNPIGLGYAQPWWITTAKVRAIPAPQIVYAGHLPAAKLFWQALCGKLKPGKSKHAKPFEPAGMGCIGRAWLPRRALIGTIDTKARWNDDEVPNLPAEFDFGYWNAAPRDQQCPHLKGDERFTLDNLCAADHPAARRNDQGDTQLRFTLPGAVLYLALGDAQGRIAAKPLVIDTVSIDPEASRIDVTWRAVVSTEAQLAHAELRVARTEEERQRLAAMLDWQRTAPPQPEPSAPAVNPVTEEEVAHGA